MGNNSKKKNVTIYQEYRSNLGLSRREASDLLECISEDRIERIENQGFTPQPDEVLIMAEKYKAPYLCNHYCSHECPIGAKYVPEVNVDNIHQIVLAMTASLNALEKKKDRLIEIMVDGKVDHKEAKDFMEIRQDLEQLSIAVEAMQLWVEKEDMKNN